MLDRAALNKASGWLQVSQDGLIRLLNMHTLEVGHLVGEATVLINGAGDGFPL